MIVLLAAAASAQSLVLSAPDPILRGSLVRLVATGSDPGATVTFAASATAGPGPCLPALGGLCADLVAPTVLVAVRAAADGTATLAFQVPAGAPLIDAWFQAGHGGLAPKESQVLGAPVLRTVAVGDTLTVTGGASLNEARHTLDVDGTLVFAAGNYPAAVTLPSLRSAAGALEVRRDLALDAPALGTAGTVLVNATNADVEVHLGALATVGVLRVWHARDLTLDLPALTVATEVDTSTVTGAFTLSAPALVTTDLLRLSVLLGAVTVDLASLATVADYLQINRLDTTTTVDGWFPALASIGRPGGYVKLGFSNNRALTHIGAFGAPGGVVVQGWVDVSLHGVLTDVSGLTNVSADDAEMWSNASLPSCHVAETIEAITGAPPTNPVNCMGNARDACSDAPGDVCWW